MNSVGDIPIDVVKSFTLKYSAKTTDHPVESGADITDNIQSMPLEFSMECIIANKPTGAPYKVDPTYAKNAYTQLIGLQTAREPVTIETTQYGMFTEMAITDISIPVTADMAGALAFTLSARQIIIVTNARTTVRSSIPAGAPKVAQGDKPTRVYGAVNGTYCIRVTQNNTERVNNTKLYGAPIPTTDIAEINFDHYKVNPEQINPDGYMTPQGHWFLIAAPAGDDGQDDNDDDPKYDPATNTYKYPDGSLVNNTTTGPGQYNRMTGKVPP